MNENEDNLRNLESRINRDCILLFDMDGTLIDTNQANLLAYKKATQNVLQSDLCNLVLSDERFNRTVLARIFPNLSDTDYDRIVQLKNEYYKDFLAEPHIMPSVVNVLKRFAPTHQTILVTNCREDRAIMTLNFHELYNYFKQTFFRQLGDKSKINKYKNAIIKLNISPDSVLVFENEESEIEDAVNAGILIDNIIVL